MKRILIFICNFSILFASSGLLFSSNADKQYALDEITSLGSNLLVPIDLNHDGTDEFLSMTNDRQFDAFKFNLKEYQHSLTHPAGKYSDFIPLPSSNLDTLKVLHHRFTKDSSIYDLGISYDEKTHFTNNFLVFTGYDRDRDGRFDRKINYIGNITNRKEERLFLFMISSGYDGAERGFLSLNPNTLQEEWPFCVGPQINSINIEDSDEDGVSDIYFGTYAPGNYASCNETDDFHSYLFRIDGDGKLRWRRQFGSKHSGVLSCLADIEGNHKSKLIAYTFNVSSDLPAKDSLMIVDKLTGRILETKIFNEKLSFNSFFANKKFAADLNNDGKDEIFLSTKSGFIWMFNDQLERINSSNYLGEKVTITNIADLDNDGFQEIICNVNQEKTLVLNHNLKKIFESSPIIDINQIVKKQGKNYLLVSNGKPPERLTYKILAFHPVYLPQKAISESKKYLPFIFSAIIILVLIFWLRTLFVGAAARKLYLMKLKNAELDDDILLVHRRKKVLHIGEAWRKFVRAVDVSSKPRYLKKIFTSKTPEELKKLVPELIKNEYDSSGSFSIGDKKYQIASKYIFALKMHALMLADASEQEYIKQLKHWALVAQRLAHGIKNPLTTVKLNAEDLKYRLTNEFGVDDPDIDEYFAAIIGQVNRLKKMADGFMRFVQFEQISLRPENLNALVHEWIDEWKAGLKGKVELLFELEENLPPALIDRDQFAVAARNVFFNAVESLNGTGKIIISTRWSQIIPGNESLAGNSGFVELQIRDTGCGISAEFLDKVISPYFTRNKAEGTGLGLSIVKKILDAHGGKILIYSEVNHGTSVSLWVKAANGFK